MAAVCPWAAGHEKEDPEEADFFQPYLRSDVITVKRFICRDSGLTEQSSDVILVKIARRRHLAPGHVIFKLGRHTWSCKSIALRSGTHQHFLPCPSKLIKPFAIG